MLDERPNKCLFLCLHFQNIIKHLVTLNKSSTNIVTFVHNMENLAGTFREHSMLAMNIHQCLIITTQTVPTALNCAVQFKNIFPMMLCGE